MGIFFGEIYEREKVQYCVGTIKLRNEKRKNEIYDTIEEALSDYESNGIISLNNSDEEQKIINITVTEDISIGETIEIGDNIELNINGDIDENEKIKLSLSNDTNAFTVNKNAKLNIKNILVDGTGVSKRKKDIVINNGNMTMINSTFENFDTRNISVYATIIKMSNASLIMDERSEIKNNVSYGNGSITVNGKCKISGGTINNSNTSRNGGAIYSNTDLTEVIIENVTFQGNYATWGGAIDLKDSKWGCDLIINNCTFDSNKSLWESALYFENLKNIQIYNCIFSSNQKNQDDDTGVIHIKNQKSSDYRTSIKMGGISFSENDSQNGMIFLDDNTYFTLLKQGEYEVNLESYSTEITTETNVFSNNKSVAKATAIYIGESSIAVIEEAVFDSNENAIEI